MLSVVVFRMFCFADEEVKRRGENNTPESSTNINRDGTVKEYTLAI